MKFLVLICCLLLVISVKAQQEVFLSRSLAMGQVQLNQPPEYALWGNPAEIVNLELPTFASSYYQLYGLKELRTITMGLMLPGNPTWAVSVAQFGSSYFKQQQAALTVSKSFGAFSLGLTNKYWLYSIAGFGQGHGWSWNLGFHLTMGAAIELALLVRNLISLPAFEDEMMNSHIHLGLGLLINPFLRMALEASHDLRSPLTLKIGLEYMVKNRIPFRVGINLQSRTAHAGLGYQSQFWHLDYALMIHTTLGITHQTSLIIKWP